MHKNRVLRLVSRNIFCSVNVTIGLLKTNYMKQMSTNISRTSYLSVSSKVILTLIERNWIILKLAKQTS